MAVDWMDVWIATDATHRRLEQWRTAFATAADWAAHEAEQSDTETAALIESLVRQREEAAAAVARRFPGQAARFVPHEELPDRWKQGVSGAYLSMVGETLEADLAVVGTREVDTSPAAPLSKWLRTLADDLPCAFISGGAVGVDTLVQKAALAAGRPVIVVVAGGLGFAGPSANLEGFRAVVAAGGAVVSERAPLVAPRRSAFLRRNRVIAAAATATLVVRSDVKGGAMSTAAHARGFQRPVFAVPGPPWERGSAGTNALLSQGAALCSSARDLVPVVAPAQRALFVETDTSRRGAVRTPPRDPVQASLHRAIERGARTLEELSRELPLSVPALQHAVLLLTLDGRVAETADGLVTT